MGENRHQSSKRLYCKYSMNTQQYRNCLIVCKRDHKESKRLRKRDRVEDKMSVTFVKFAFHFWSLSNWPKEWNFGSIGRIFIPIVPISYLSCTPRLFLVGEHIVENVFVKLILCWTVLLAKIRWSQNIYPCWHVVGFWSPRKNHFIRPVLHVWQ